MFHDIVCEEDLANVAAIMDTNVEVSDKAMMKALLQKPKSML